MQLLEEATIEVAEFMFLLNGLIEKFMWCLKMATKTNILIDRNKWLHDTDLVIAKQHEWKGRWVHKKPCKEWIRNKDCKHFTRARYLHFKSEVDILFDW